MKSSNRTFDIRNDAEGNTIKVNIIETHGIKAENLGLGTWGSSFVLSNQLYHWKDNAAKSNTSESIIPVLELGAGTSLVGISAAAIWHTKVIVTDLAPLMSGLSENIHANEGLSKECSASISCGTLDWSQPSELRIYNPSGEAEVLQAYTTKANIILAADTLYDEEHPELLDNAIQAWLAPGSEARVIICYALRHAYLDHIREMWERLEYAGLVCIEEGKADPDPDTWDDVAPFEWCVWKRKEGGDGVSTPGK